MSGDISPKLKIVYLMKILLEKTDESHAITMPEIISSLKAYGITAERKSIYSDIELLRLYGMDIIGEQRDRAFYYNVGNRQFELAELKLLVDSVQSAKFITEKKSNALIKKIEGLASHYEATKLQRQVYVAERIKTDNEQILYNIDAIHNAIAENSQIEFLYFYWNVDKKQEPRRNGESYIMSPWALTLAEENYYLVCYDAAVDMIKYFRVDKMLNIRLTEKGREGKERFEHFDIAAYARKRFRMYDGVEKKVTLVCKNSYANVIIDRFGKDIPIIKTDEEHFKVTVEVAVSNQFLAWVLSMNEGIKITAPEDVVEQVKTLIKDMAAQYL